MQETMQKMIRGFMKQRTQRRRAYAAFTALAILVSITTVYTLVQPASTMEAELTCGMEEHVHTEECYAEVLICGMEEGEAEITVDPEAPVEPEAPVDPETPAEPEAPVNPETPEVPPVEEEASSAEGEPSQEPPAVTEEPEAPAETPAEEEQESEVPVETPAEEEKESEVPAEAPAKEEKEAESSAEKADSESPRESEPAGSDSEEGGTIEAVSVQNSNGPEDGEAGVHHHTAACYKKVLICGKEEHEHSSNCYESVLPEQGDMMLVLPEGAEIPEGYDREYSFIDSDNRFGVKVYAPEGALPEGAVLVAELLEEDSDAYTAAGEALEAMANGETPIVVADQSVVEQPVEKTDAEEAPAEEETTVEEPVEEETPVVEEPAAEEEVVEEEPVCEEAQAEEAPAEGELEASLPLYAEGPEADVTETETEEPAEAEEPAAEEEETESGFSYDGFVALDIHFEVDGKEVEPTAPVYVCINALGLLPETADPETVAVQHHAEVDKKLLGIIPVGTDTVVETVADSTEETGPVEVSENAEDYTQDVMTAFAVDGFSTFTITYTSYYTYELDVQIVDQDGNDIPVSDIPLTKSTLPGTTSWESVSSLMSSAGLESEYTTESAKYTFQGAKTESDGDVYFIKINTSRWYEWRYSSSESKPDENKDGSGFEKLYLVYNKENVAPVIIERDIQNHKYVTDNGDGTYNLNLTVSGALGSFDSKVPVDILFIVDKSASMNEKMSSRDSKLRITAVKDAINGLADTVSESKSIDARYSLVTFSRCQLTSVDLDWTNSKADLESKVNSISPNGGTNYEAGIYYGINQIDKANQDRPDSLKYVIFLTDGLPTYRGTNVTNSSGSENSDPVNGSGNGRNDRNGYNIAAAVNRIKGLTCNAFYAVGAGPDFDEGDTGLENLNKLCEAVNAETSQFFSATSTDDLNKAFSKITAEVNYVYCSNVTITDTLNDHVEIVKKDDGTPTELLITVEDTDGKLIAGPATSVTLGATERNKYPVTLTPVYDLQTKTIKLDFDADPDYSGATSYVLEPDYVYKATAKIQPTDEAYEYYAANGYTDTGDKDTGVTSEEKAGLYSNVDASGTNMGKVTYDFNEETGKTKEYPKPVVQLNIGSLVIEKEIYGLTDAEINELLNAIQFPLMSGTTTIQMVTPVLSGTGANAQLTDIVDDTTDEVIGKKLTVTVLGITPGSYTVTESGYNKAGTKTWTATGSKNSETSTTVTIVKGSTATATLVNNYKLGTGNLKLTKVVSYTGVPTYTTNQVFTFTITSEGIEANKSYKVSYTGSHSSTTEITADDDGVLTVTLSQDESVTIEGLSSGKSATITESDESTKGYAVSWGDDIKSSATAKGPSVDSAAIVAGGTVNVTCTNTTGAALPSTGGIGTHLYTFLGTVLMLGAGVLLLNRRRRKEGPDAV